MRAAFFDVDGTLTDVRVWQGVMDYFKHKRIRQWTARWFWVVHMPLWFAYKAKLISQSAFRRPWAARLSWLFRGYTEDQAKEIWDWVVEQHLVSHWRQDICDLLREHSQNGDLVVLVSAGPGPLVQRIAEEVGANLVVATRHEVREGRYTGKHIPPVCMDEHKGILASEKLLEAGMNIDLPNSYAYADSPGDLALLELVGNPRAVYPDDELKQIAISREWVILP